MRPAVHLACFSLWHVLEIGKRTSCLKLSGEPTVSAGIVFMLQQVAATLSGTDFLVVNEICLQ